MRIETDHRNANERQPGTLSRWEYIEVEAPKVENEDPEVTQCGASKPAIVVYGDGAGTTRTICIDPECPVHHPSRVVPIDPDAESRRKEHESRSRRLPKAKQSRRRPQSESLPNPTEGPAMPPPARTGGTMIQFTYKLKLNERVRATMQSPTLLQPRGTGHWRMAW